MMDCCEQLPSGEFLQAVDAFNRGEWYESHHTFEKLWSREKGELRYFCQGIIQIGAALYHWRKGNFDSAASLLARGAGNVRRVQPICLGVDAEEFAAAADRLLRELQNLGPGRMAELDPALVPRMRLVGIRSRR